MKLCQLFFFFFSRKLYIADARPRKNALANGAMGGGSESSSNYFQSEVCLWFKLSFISILAINLMSYYLTVSFSFCVFFFFKNLFLFYFYYQIVFFGIDNIHSMRDSLARLRDYLDTYGATSSDGMSSFLVSSKSYIVLAAYQ